MRTILDFSHKDVVEYINSTRSKFETLRDMDAKEAGENERNLSQQLMLISTVLLTAAVVALGNKDLLTILSIFERVLIFVSLALIVISMVFAVIHQFRNIGHILQWANTRHSIVEFINKQDYSEDSLKTYVQVTQANIPISANAIWLNLQITALAVAVASFITDAVLLLFA